jgi:Ni/Co efflux regulator RcnB
MRSIVLATVAAFALSTPLALSAKAEDTTVIKKENGFGDKTVIKKKEPSSTTVIKKEEPRVDKKVIIDHGGGS